MHPTTTPRPYSPQGKEVAYPAEFNERQRPVTPEQIREDYLDLLKDDPAQAEAFLDLVFEKKLFASPMAYYHFMQSLNEPADPQEQESGECVGHEPGLPRSEAPRPVESSAPETDRSGRVVLVGPNLKNFHDILSALDSADDEVFVGFSGELSVRMARVFGITLGGEGHIRISRGDDGFYYVEISGTGNLGGEIGLPTRKTGRAAGNLPDVEGGIGVGLGVANAFRFRDRDAVNQFLLQTLHDELPALAREHLLPNLDAPEATPQYSMLEAGFNQLWMNGSLKIPGGYAIDGELLVESRTVRHSMPDGEEVESHDWEVTGQSRTKVMESVELAVETKRFYIDKDPLVPENTGLYQRVEGELILDVDKFLPKGAGKLTSAMFTPVAAAAAEALGLTGEQKAAFMLSFARELLENAPSGGKISISFTAQWEVTSPEATYFSSEGEQACLQYVRLGAGFRKVVEGGSDKLFVEGKYQWQTGVTDMTDVILGTEDESFLQTQFKYNRAYYEVLKETLGDREIKTADPVRQAELASEGRTGLTLEEWEARWLAENA